MADGNVLRFPTAPQTPQSPHAAGASSGPAYGYPSSAPQSGPANYGAPMGPMGTPPISPHAGPPAGHGFATAPVQGFGQPPSSGMPGMADTPCSTNWLAPSPSASAARSFSHFFELVE